MAFGLRTRSPLWGPGLVALALVVGCSEKTASEPPAPIRTAASALGEPVWQMWSTGAEQWSQTELLYLPSSQAVLALGYGRAELWTRSWDGSWSEASQLTPAPTIDPGAVALDRARSRVVVVDAEGTWEWKPPDGSWQLGANASAGPPSGSPLAYDENRSVTVAYDETTGDLWEWDGSSWKHVAVSGPVARERPAMTYDAVRRGVVIHGGSRWDNSSTGQVGENDTWLYDGTAMTEIAASGTGPSLARIVFDREQKRLQLVVPETGAGVSIWEIRAGEWQRVQTDAPAPFRVLFGAAYHEADGVTLLSGGSGGRQFHDGLWSWDGQKWSMLESASSPPATDAGYVVEAACSLTYAGFLERVVLVTDGSAWEWDGSRWWQQASGVPALQDTALAYDSARERLVLVGTADDAALELQTWEYDGESWTRMASSTAPASRWGSCMTYDVAHSRTVLFGGRVRQSIPGGWTEDDVADTWEWDGQRWVEVPVVDRPVGRIWHGMAWDGAEHRVVMFGGSGGPTGELDDTWAYDGSTWKELVSQPRPPPYFGRLAYDDVEQRIVLVGGAFDVKPGGRTWFLHGDVWSPLASSTEPDGDGSITFDPLHRQVVFFGSQNWLMTVPDCASADDCATGFCVDGVCCDSACGGDQADDGLACSVQAGAERNGICAEVPVPPAADSSDERAAGGCVTAPTRPRSLPVVALLVIAMAAAEAGHVTGTNDE